ncbi:MAG: exodeoxyribonuclease V subunit alpha, partial [Ferrimonas sp.]
APTGKAAARLSESLASTLTAITAGQVDEIDAEIGARIPTTVTTLHRLLGARSDTRRFVHNAVNPLNLDVLVVDEASMVDLEMMANLLAAVPVHARLILLGDKDQLASVEAGAVLGDLCDQAEKGHYQADTEGFIFRTTGYSVRPYIGAGHGLEQQTVMLRKSHRFGEKSGIGQLARAINRGDVDEARAVLLNSHGDVAYLKNSDTEFKALVLDGQVAQLQPLNGQQPHGYRHYLSIVQQGASAFASETEWQRAVLDAFAQFQVLAALREGEWGVQGLNKRIAHLLYQQRLISQEQGWYAGRPVMVQRNDYSLDLMNGDIGICLPVQDPHQTQSLRVIFPMADGTLKAVQPSRLEEVETVFVMTVHKSQGSEFAHTALVLPESGSPVLTRELIYTGVTRAKLWFSLLINQPAVVREAIKKRTIRASGLKQRLYALK